MYRGIISAAVGYTAYWLINTPSGKAVADKAGKHLLKQLKIPVDKLTTVVKKGKDNESDLRNDSTDRV